VPIRSAPLIRSPPTLLPISKGDAEDQSSTAKTSPASNTQKSVSIENRVAKPVQETKATSSSNRLNVKSEAKEVVVTNADSKTTEENEASNTQREKSILNSTEVGKDDLKKCSDLENGRVNSVNESINTSSLIQNESVAKQNSSEPIELKSSDMTISESLVNSENNDCTTDEEKSVKATAESVT
jgi:hypothetical protein